MGRWPTCGKCSIRQWTVGIGPTPVVSGPSSSANRWQPVTYVWPQETIRHCLQSTDHCPLPTDHCQLTTDKPMPDWKSRLDLIVETMRDMSRHTDPQEMVRAYARRIRQLTPAGRRLSLSRRGLEYPRFRITRSTTWAEEINPWKERDRLPLFNGGFLAELIYGGEPRVIDELTIRADEPAAEYLAGCRSLLAIPMYDQGESLNMVV